MFDNKGRFIIENFNKKATFSSFLPGISGLKGIPIWCFYINRGQGICSFGVEDKNHSIMEFYPAHQSYQLTDTHGFRTFLRVDGSYYEPFTSSDMNNKSRKMFIGRNEIEIEEINEVEGLKINVTYYIVPNEKVGGLVRSVKVENLRSESRTIEVLDGMPAIIPYGIELTALKEMAQTMKAWMQVEDCTEGLPYYRVRYSTKDSSVVSKIEEGNYYFSVDEEGNYLNILADADAVFNYDSSFKVPVNFAEGGLKAVMEYKEIHENLVPSAFTAFERVIKGFSVVEFTTVAGQASNKEVYHGFARRCQEKDFFTRKHKEAIELVEALTNTIACKTSNEVFDEYCRTTFMDNALRGGYPVEMGNGIPFYVYSRKHGDPERDYNFFRMVPEYYSQGNGNFRDVNQNRRSDVLFFPYVGDYNIKAFYNLIQLDGYNPLIIQQSKFKVKDAKILDIFHENNKSLDLKFLKGEFTPGQLYRFLEVNEKTLNFGENKNSSIELLFEEIMKNTEEVFKADFGEGYWTDHWTYNLDLIEAYFKIYPEKVKELLFEDKTYTFFQNKAVILPRRKRYVETLNGIRQYNYLDESIEERIHHCEARCEDGQGEVYYSNLMTKLMVLAVCKFGALDMEGMGIEMEGGKPGWYDALNGLPGIFGSSMSEAYELYRLLNFIRNNILSYEEDVILPTEAYDFILGTYKVLLDYYTPKLSKFQVWQQVNDIKEQYRSKVASGIKGTEQTMRCDQVTEVINFWISYMEEGINKALELGKGVPPTYFTYEMAEYKKEGEAIIPISFKLNTMPAFLEGPVRYFKTPLKEQEKKQVYKRVKESSLFDRSLEMYKVNESLKEVTFEAGRAKAFSAGWLENESIWLHMEYKYLLELLKAGLYEEFFNDFHKAGIPFLSYETYGRCPLENSSFIVSSANINERLHGRGFVARLSGSTAEFVDMWQTMMFGPELFKVQNKELTFKLQPAIPSYLIPEDGTIETTLLGSIKVTYFLSKELVKGGAGLIPGSYSIEEIHVEYENNEARIIKGSSIAGAEAKDIRNKIPSQIKVYINL